MPNSAGSPGRNISERIVRTRRCTGGRRSLLHLSGAERVRLSASREQTHSCRHTADPGQLQRPRAPNEGRCKDSQRLRMRESCKKMQILFMNEPRKTTMELQPNTNHNQALWKEIPWDFTEDCSLSVSGTTFLIVAYSTVMAVGLIGNSCLLFVITRHKEMHNVTNIFIANLSFSDILMCIVCLPVTIIYTLTDRWILGDVLCKLTPFVQCISVTVSIFSLVLIAMERYQLIVHPTGWKPMVGQSYLAVAVTWIVACLISVPFLSYSVLALPFQNLSIPFPVNDHPVCMERWPSVQERRAYTTSLLVFQYFLPLALIMVCYLHIYLRLRRRKDMVERGRNTTQKKNKGATRINAMLIAIVVAFALSWLPLNVFNTVFDWNHEAIPTCGHDIIFSFCHLTAMASTCVNPIIYGFLNSNFQKQLKSTLLRCRCWGVAERYESVPLSTVSTEVTKGSILSNGSISINT